ncbi:MAG: alpha/beta hydrolase [Methylobacteriaceae bacterium]|nr:alpha/beta hydrolase [Methylobacteriaceae bacterium]
MQFRRTAAALAAAALTFLVAGCGGRPEGTLVPAQAVANASSVDLLVATTRGDAAPGEMFNGERGRGLSFADIAISIPPDGAREIGEVQWPSSAHPNPNREFATLRADRIDLKEALRRFHGQVATKPKNGVLVFVHGYNTRFEEAVYRFAQIVHDSRAQVTPVLFTWPSRGKLLAYAYDRESATYSRDGLESALQALANDPKVGEISILAHSMGNWVTIEALRQMSIRNRGISKKIRNVMLAAPDVDVDVFRRQIRLIDEGRTRPDFTLFVSRDDDALAVSRLLWGSTDRVGAIDPNKEPYRSKLQQSDLRVVDLSDIKTGDPTGHAKFAESPEVVKMIGARLSSGQALSDSRAGLGEKLSTVAIGAANVVGRTAGVAVSAPLAIVDGRTREGLSDQIEELGASASGVVGSAARVPVTR